MTTQRRHTKPGMALPEFLITLAILSILATVVVVSYVNFIDRARIAADDSITEQLNLLITAHKIETGELPTGDEISQILRDGGVTFDQITPSSTNRHLYYDNIKGCFVWIDDDDAPASDDSNYTPITGDMLTPTETKDDNGKSDETEGNKEQTDETEKKEPTPQISIKTEFNSDNIKMIDGEIYISNAIQNSSDCIKLNIADILENVNDDIEEVQCTPISTVDYGYSKKYDASGSTLIFYCPGMYELQISCRGTEQTVTVNVINSTLTAAASLSTSGSPSTNTSGYNDELKTSGVLIHVFGGLNLNDYSSVSSKEYTEILDGDKGNNKDIQKEIIESNRLKIICDGEELEIKCKDGHYYIQFDNLQVGIKHNIKLEYRFLSYNGTWVSQTFVFSFNLTKSQANNKSITIP